MAMSTLLEVLSGAVAGWLSCEAVHAWGRHRTPDEMTRFENARRALRALERTDDDGDR